VDSSGHAVWDGWDAPGRSWDGCKSENRLCLPALGRWDGCTPPSHTLPALPPTNCCQLQLYPHLSEVFPGVL